MRSSLPFTPSWAMPEPQKMPHPNSIGHMRGRRHQIPSTRCRPSTKACVLAYPNPSQTFIVDTDASDVGMGAKPQRNYCVTRRELLAVAKAPAPFQGPPLQKSLSVADGSLLRHLASKFQGARRSGVARWIEVLHDFKILQRAGQLHGNEEALSLWP